MTTITAVVRRTRQLRQSGPIFSFTQFSFDPATIAWVAAVVVAGGTVSAARETLVNNLITGLKSDGVWTKLDRLWVLAAENQASALTDMVADKSATAVNSPTFTTDRGFTGDGSTSYVSTGYNASTNGVNYTLNSASFGVWMVSAPTQTAFFTPVGANAGAGSQNIIQSAGGSYFPEVNDNDATLAFLSQTAGLFTGTRTGSSARTAYHNNDAGNADTAASVSIPNQTMTICVRGDLVASTFTTDQIACGFMGGGLTTTNVGNLYSRLRTYMTAVGVP